MREKNDNTYIEILVKVKETESERIKDEAKGEKSIRNNDMERNRKTAIPTIK